MMTLREIKDKVCPICGAEIVSETKCRQHTNGYYNEYRVFGCGYQLHFSPNFMNTSKVGMCLNSSEYKLREKKREKVKQELKSYINSLDVDDSYKSQCLFHLNIN